MRRRDVITLLGGAAVAWPPAARTQQRESMRRIGALMGWSQTDPEFRLRFSSFVAGLTQRGWVEGRSIQIEQWWTDGDIDRARTPKIAHRRVDQLFP